MRREYQTRDVLRRRPGPVHVRIDQPDGSKRMYWPVGTKPTELLYLASDRPEFDPTESVVIVEGERSADAVAAAGYQAIGTVCGASSIPDDAVISWMTNFRVILWPDRDRIGRQHMGRIGTKLECFGVADLRIARSPEGDDDGLDAADLKPSQIRKIIDACVDTLPIGPLA